MSDLKRTMGYPALQNPVVSIGCRRCRSLILINTFVQCRTGIKVILIHPAEANRSQDDSFIHILQICVTCVMSRRRKRVVGCVIARIRDGGIARVVGYLRLFQTVARQIPSHNASTKVDDYDQKLCEGAKDYLHRHGGLGRISVFEYRRNGVDNSHPNNRHSNNESKKQL